MNPIETIYINNVATDVEVINGVFKFPYNVGQELTAIRFVGTTANNTITSINLKKADLFASVSHLDYCFMNCTALTEIDFGKKSFGSLQHAVNAFKGCTELTTIKIDASSEWAPDVDLSDCPLTYTSMLAMANALKTYSSGTHTMKLSGAFLELTPEQQATIKGIANSKNWNIPTFDQGKYTYQQLSAMIADGYVPVASGDEYLHADVDGSFTMGAGTIFEGTYLTSPSTKYVQVRNYKIGRYGSGIQRQIGGIYDGACLTIDARTTDWYTAGMFNINTGGVVRNVYFIAYGADHNGNNAFCSTNDGIIEDCYIDGHDSKGGTSANALLCSINNGIIRRTKHRYFRLGGNINNLYGTFVGVGTNNGTIKDCYTLGAIGNIRNPACLCLNNTNGTIQNCYTNLFCKGSGGSGLVRDTGIGTDNYCNSDHNCTGNKNATPKTTAQLKSDTIGNGIYINWSSDIWQKDIEGFPELKSLILMSEDNDWSDCVTYDAISWVVESLTDYTNGIAHIVQFSDTLWQSLTDIEKNTLTTSASAKNWSILTI